MEKTRVLIDRSAYTLMRLDATDKMVRKIAAQNTGLRLAVMVLTGVGVTLWAAKKATQYKLERLEERIKDLEDARMA